MNINTIYEFDFELKEASFGISKDFWLGVDFGEE